MRLVQRNLALHFELAVQLGVQGDGFLVEAQSWEVIDLAARMRRMARARARALRGELCGVDMPTAAEATLAVRPPLARLDQLPTTKQTLVVPLPPMLSVAIRLAPSTW